MVLPQNSDKKPELIEAMILFHRNLHQKSA
jgi:hypothetical protein